VAALGRVTHGGVGCPAPSSAWPWLAYGLAAAAWASAAFPSPRCPPTALPHRLLPASRWSPRPAIALLHCPAALLRHSRCWPALCRLLPRAFARPLRCHHFTVASAIPPPSASLCRCWPARWQCPLPSQRRRLAIYGTARARFSARPTTSRVGVSNQALPTLFPSLLYLPYRRAPSLFRRREITIAQFITPLASPPCLLVARPHLALTHASTIASFGALPPLCC
jgi:hypothetical protein